MTSVEWYYARGTKQMGPVSAAELKRLATAGELRPEDLVWREGMTEWSVARNVRGLFEEEGKPAAAAAGPPAAKVGESAVKLGEPAPQPAATAAAATTATATGQGGAAPARHLFDMLLDAARPHFNAHFIEATARTFRACGSYGLLAAMVVIVVFQLIMTIKTGELNRLLLGAVWILAAAVLQYAGNRLCGALEELNRTAGGSLRSTAFPDCVALLSIVGGVATLLLLVALFVGDALYAYIIFAIAAFLVWGFLAALALNPAALNISVEPNLSVGQQAIGVLTFLTRALARLVPVAFGAGVICGFLLLGYACGEVFSGEKGPSLADVTAHTARRGLGWSAFLPLAGYVLFLLASLVLDLCRAILGLPSSLDKPAEQEQGQGGRM